MTKIHPALKSVAANPLPWPAAVMILALTAAGALHSHPHLLAPAATYLQMAGIALR